jgi:branched-chain amino acid transport system permease protein
MSNWFSLHEAIIQATLVYMVLAASVQVSLRSGLFSFASIGCWGLGQYASARLALWDQPLILSLLTAVAIGVAVSAVLALITRRLRGLYLAMATFAFDLVLIVLFSNGGSLTGGALGLYAVPVEVHTWMLVVVVVAVGLLLAWHERGWRGRRAVLLGKDEELASTLGINVRATHFKVFLLSGALGALSGAMNALLFNSVTPDQANFSLVILIVTMVVIGGVESWLGAFIGAVVATWLPELLTGLADWQQPLYGGLLMVIVVYAPRGVMGLLRPLLRRVARLTMPKLARGYGGIQARAGVHG